MGPTKEDCDRVSLKLLEVLQAEAADYPRALVLAIAFGSVTALAYASRVPLAAVLAMVASAWENIEAGE